MKHSFFFTFLTFSLTSVCTQAQIPGPKPLDPKKDPVLALLRSVHDKYSKRDFNGAAQDLTLIQKQLDTIRSSQASILLPDLEGWKATELEKQGAFGAGKVMRRTYLRDPKDLQAAKEGKGNHQVTAELTMDSPVVKGLAALLSNDAIAKGAGYKTDKIEGHEALLKEGEKSSEVSVLLGNGVLFKLVGAGGIGAADLASLARKFDLKAMQKLETAAKP